MKELGKRMDFIFGGFFYFFGFTSNPAADEVKKIMENSPSDKIKADLKRINKDYRKSYLRMKQNLLCLEQ